MFSSIGFGELAVICIVLIIAVGPERLPTMMKTVGKTVRTLRQASRDIRTATGIDEMMRDEMFDINARPQRKYQQPPGPTAVSRTPQAVAAVPAASTTETPETPASETPASEAPASATPASIDDAKPADATKPVVTDVS